MLQEELEAKPKLSHGDPKEIQIFFRDFYEKNVKEGEYKKKP